MPRFSVRAKRHVLSIGANSFRVDMNAFISLSLGDRLQPVLEQIATADGNRSVGQVVGRTLALLGRFPRLPSGFECRAGARLTSTMFRCALIDWDALGVGLLLYGLA